LGRNLEVKVLAGVNMRSGDIKGIEPGLTWWLWLDSIVTVNNHHNGASFALDCWVAFGVFPSDGSEKPEKVDVDFALGCRLLPDIRRRGGALWGCGTINYLPGIRLRCRVEMKGRATEEKQNQRLGCHGDKRSDA
jgi:hypothetical protein